MPKGNEGVLRVPAEVEKLAFLDGFWQRNIGHVSGKQPRRREGGDVGVWIVGVELDFHEGHEIMRIMGEKRVVMIAGGDWVSFSIH